MTTLGFDVVLATSTTNASQVAPYKPDIVVATAGCGVVTKFSLLLDLYNQGYRIYSHGNDTHDIYPISSSVLLDPAPQSGDVSYWPFDHPIQQGWYATYNSGTDRRYGITALVPGSTVIARDIVNGYIEVSYTEEPRKGRWFHIQPSPQPDNTLLNNGFFYLVR